MKRFLIRAIPFMLTLMIGVALDSLVHKPFQRAFIKKQRCAKFRNQSHAALKQGADEVVRLRIESVPDAEFPEIVKKQRRHLYAHARFEALFDANGSIKFVRPYRMLPYGVTESAAVGSQEFAGVTPFMVDSQFVDSLPHGLTELAIQQISGIVYSPRKVNGHLDRQRITVITNFSYSESRYAVGCSEIHVTLMDDVGVLWKGNTWVSRNRGCLMH
jgi:hypothetical protein